MVLPKISATGWVITEVPHTAYCWKDDPGIYTVSPIQLLTKSENPTIKNPFLKDNTIFKKRKEKPIVLKSNTKLKSNIKPEPSLMTVESKAF